MAETVCEWAATCAIFPAIPFGSSERSLSFCAAVCRRRCTVETSAGLLTAPFSHSPTLPLILKTVTGGEVGAGGVGAGGVGAGGVGAPFSHAVITLASVFT